MRTFLVIALILLVSPIVAQNKYQKDIATFHAQDSVQFPGEGKILFVGSSSFTLWKDVQSDFPSHSIINRGFGGSTLTDVLFFKDDVIKRYAPRQVVVYCGENDLAGGATPNQVAESFMTLFEYIRSNFPECHVVFVSIKPSPSRAHIFGQMKQTNALIKEYLSQQKNVAYVDVFSKMIDKKGNIRGELFVEDRLHMNRKGYDIWKSEIAPLLL